MPPVPSVALLTGTTSENFRFAIILQAAVLAVCICTNGMHMHMHVHMQDARPGGVHMAIEKRLLCGA